MHNFCRLTILAGVLTANLLAATVGFTVTEVGTTGMGDTVFRYTYSPSGFDFNEDRELLLRFDPALYSSLTNPVVPTGFDPLVFQPDNPPGAFGDFSIFAPISGLSVGGVFSIDFIFLGSGTPGAQPFVINDFVNGDIMMFTSGSTVPDSGPVIIPEPSTIWFGSLGLLLPVVWRGVHGRKRSKFNR